MPRQRRSPSGFEQPLAGSWLQPKMKGYIVACCDCGAVHKLNFRVTAKGLVEIQVFAAPRATKLLRKLEQAHLPMLSGRPS